MWQAFDPFNRCGSGIRATLARIVLECLLNGHLDIIEGRRIAGYARLTDDCEGPSPGLGNKPLDSTVLVSGPVKQKAALRAAATALRT